MFLYNPAVVTFVDAGAPTVNRSTTGTQVTKKKGEPALSLSPGRIDPTNAVWNASRKPLVGEFEFNGQDVFVIANHFDAKLGDQSQDGRFQFPAQSSAGRAGHTCEGRPAEHDRSSAQDPVDPIANGTGVRRSQRRSAVQWQHEVGAGDRSLDEPERFGARGAMLADLAWQHLLNETVIATSSARLSSAGETRATSEAAILARPADRPDAPRRRSQHEHLMISGGVAARSA